MSLLYIDGLGIQRDMSEVYLSSDEHLGHANILRYAARPYDNIWHMNEDIIAKHNKKVPEKDSLWICLGDFAFVRGDSGNTLTEQLRNFVQRFNGEKKVLIIGYHDRQHIGQYLAAGFDYVVPKASDVKCSVDKFRFVMRHRPYSMTEMQKMMQKNANHCFHSAEEAELVNKYLKFDKTNRGAWMYDLYPIKGNVICGHVHQLYRRYAKGNVVNAGVDVWDMSPVRLEEVLALLD